MFKKTLILASLLSALLLIALAPADIAPSSDRNVKLQDTVAPPTVGVTVVVSSATPASGSIPVTSGVPMSTLVIIGLLVILAIAVIVGGIGLMSRSSHHH